MKYMKIKFIAMLLSVLGCIVFPQSSYATDVKEYPGSMCQSYFGTGSDKITKTGGSRTYNNASGPMWITCPVVKDNFSGSNGIERAVVYIIRGSKAVDSFYCQFRNTSVNGYLGSSDSDRTFTIGNSLLSFNVNWNLTGSYVFQCRVPKNSQIVSYKVYEYDSVR